MKVSTMFFLVSNFQPAPMRHQLHYASSQEARTVKLKIDIVHPKQNALRCGTSQQIHQRVKQEIISNFLENLKNISQPRKFDLIVLIIMTSD
ncbi:MLX-interacting protein [Trichinella pseudospiralis]